MYQRFGELIESVATKITRGYPKAVLAFHNLITSMLETERGGFASKSIQSEAKSELVKKLSNLKTVLAPYHLELTKSEAESRKTRVSNLT